MKGEANMQFKDLKDIVQYAIEKEKRGSGIL